MSNPDITPERKALALAALALNVHVDYDAYQEFHTVNYVGKLIGLADSAIEALARAAEALGLEPDPAVQQQEQTPAGMVTMTVPRELGEWALRQMFRRVKCWEGIKASGAYGELETKLHEQDQGWANTLAEALGFTPDPQEGGKPDA